MDSDLLRIHAELAALRREVKAQSAVIRHLVKARHDDDSKLIALLAAISAEVGSESWSVALLFDLALDEAPDLLHAIVAIVGKRKAGNQHRRLGMFLQQNLGVTGSYHLELASRGRDGNVYRVTVVSQVSHNKFSSAA